MATEQVHEVPAVVRTIDGHVQVTLSVDQAHVLTHLLAHYDVLTTSPASKLAAAAFTAVDIPDAPALEPVPGYVHEVWHHTLIRLATERAHALGVEADVVYVDVDGTPFARSAR